MAGNDNQNVSELLALLAKRGPAFNPRYCPETGNAELAVSHEKIENAIHGMTVETLVYHQGNAFTLGENPIVLSKTTPEESVELILALSERLAHMLAIWRNCDTSDYPLDPEVDVIGQIMMSIFGFMDSLLAKKLPFSDDQLNMLLRYAADTLEVAKSVGFTTWHYPTKKIVRASEKFVKTEGYTDAFNTTVARLIDVLHTSDMSEQKKLALRLARLNADNLSLCLVPGEAWSDNAINFISEKSNKRQDDWKALLLYCSTAKTGKPSAKWISSAQAQIDLLGKEAFVESVNQWFPLVGLPRTQPITQWNEWMPDPNQLIVDIHADVLKGLVWMCGVLQSTECAVSLGKLGLTAYKKVPGVGPRCSKVGNACVWALGQIPDDSALASLAMLKVKVKFRPAQKGIGAAMEAAAERVGMSAAELEELGVPEFGFSSIGERREVIGEFTAIFTVQSASKSTLVWETNKGKIQKTVPKAVKEHFPDELKELRQSGKDALNMLSAVRERLDSYMRTQRSWQYADWLSCYWDHPLTGILSRSLIWTFCWEDGTERYGTACDGICVDTSGAEISALDSVESIRLWHPINSSEKAIVAWRSWLQKNETTQPFKQAHREIYLLTDAERATNTYSNRFASHILKQHQFNVLCATRGWRSTTRLMVDDTYEPPSVELSDFGLRAEFWVEGVGEEYGADTTEAGSYLYLATDQVRFYSIDSAVNTAHATGGGYGAEGGNTTANQPLALTEIPPLALSEVLRDVDLFVGVASVGNDPNWSDGGAEGRHLDYWNAYSFGALSETAQTRKAILESLVPRLKIRDVCSIEDHFLKVKGKLRTYKIHLGSSNVLMEPNNQYLCIVPAQARNLNANKVFLPFEGDSRLTIILSKAFFLAADDKITDSTVLTQINGSD